MVKKILIGPSSFDPNYSGPLIKLKESGFDVIENPFKRKIKKQELMHILNKDVIGLLAGLETLDDEVLSSSSLKVISRVGSGISNIDTKSIEKNNIKLFSIPNGPVDSVAELTVGNIINLFKQTIPMNNYMHTKSWNRILGNEMKNKNVVIIGFGRIGKRLANILSSFNMNIFIVDPFVNQNKEKDDFKFLNLDEALPIADIVTIHVNIEECIISDQEFGMMKKGSYLCNASRGGVVDEKALIRSIENNRISGAWIDAFVEEPYFGKMSQMDQIILTPHIGSYTKECRYNMEMEATENLLNHI